MGSKISRNKKRNRNTNNSNQNILNYNSYNYSNSINSNIINNIDLTNIDSLIDNNAIDNMINSDLSSSTDDYIDYYDAIMDLDFRDTVISTTSNIIVVDNRYNNNNNNNIITNSSSNSNIINLNHYSSIGTCGNSNNSSTYKDGWYCSSMFVTYNIKRDTSECSKELVSNVKKRISTFKKSLKIEQLDLNLKEFQFNSNIDLISTVLSKELQYSIVSYLSIYDILSLFKVNKYWYELSLNNGFWKSLLYRDMDNWSNREAVELTIKNYESLTQMDISWKKYYSNIYRLRLCKKCAVVYRECSNNLNSCCYHADIRDIVHSRGVPSGVYWICCLSKPKFAPGCTTSCHEEENQFDYLPANSLK